MRVSIYTVRKQLDKAQKYSADLDRLSRPLSSLKR